MSDKMRRVCVECRKVFYGLKAEKVCKKCLDMDADVIEKEEEEEAGALREGESIKNCVKCNEEFIGLIHEVHCDKCYSELDKEEKLVDEIKTLMAEDSGKTTVVELVENALEKVESIPHDKDDSKVRFSLVGLDFVGAMAKVFQDGIRDDRKANGWKDIDWIEENETRFFDALMRHLQTAIDDKSDLEHLAAVAVNAYIVWHHRKEKGL